MSATKYSDDTDSTINDLEKWQVIDVKPEGVTLNDEFIKNTDRLKLIIEDKVMIKPDELIAYMASVDIRATARSDPRIAPMRDAMGLLVFHIFTSANRSVTTGVAHWHNALPPIEELANMTLGLQAILKEMQKRNAHL